MKINDIIKLILDTPNDTELGKKVRNLFNNFTKDLTENKLLHNERVRLVILAEILNSGEETGYIETIITDASHLERIGYGVDLNNESGITYINIRKN